MSFPARHSTECPDCGERIRVGDLIVSTLNRWSQPVYVHDVCPDPQLTRMDIGPKEEVCSECFVVKPCLCES